MRGKWDLDSTELEFWQNHAEKCTTDMKNGKITLVDLTREDITPYQVNQVLESLGWERYNEYPSIEGGRYAYYHKHDYKDIVVYCSGLTFELVVYLKENLERVDFKKEHIRRMMGED